MRVQTLDNGLTVIVHEHQAAPVATAWVWYRAGSRNEIPGRTGISHWVEHMLFKGTPAHPGRTLTRLIDRLGGRWNAFTWKDYTAYHEVLPAEHLGVALELEADRMAHTLFDPAEVDLERTVIIAEREGSENSPAYLLREEVDAVAFKTHPYRFPVIGWKDDLRAITRDDLLAHYSTYYHPGNATLVVVGAFDAAAILETVRRVFGEIPPGPAPPPVRGQEPVQEGERRVRLQRPGGATAYLVLAYHVPEAAHPDLAALLVADGLLSGFKSILPFDGSAGGRSSRLYRALVDTGLASEVSTSLIPGIDPTLFRVAATVRTGVDVALVEDRALRELDRLAHEPVDLAELAKVKQQAKAQVVYAQDGVYRIALGLGAFGIVDRPETFMELLHRIELVTPDEIVRVAVMYFHDRNRTIGVYLPEPGAGAAPLLAASGAAGRIPDASNRQKMAGFSADPTRWLTLGRPGSGPVPLVPGRTEVRPLPITAQTVTRAELGNGLVVLVKEVPRTGMVAVGGYVKAGAMFDGDGGGLSRFTAAMLQRGTVTRSSQQIAETLDGMGASLSFRADQEVVGVGLRALREDFPATLDIMAEVLMAPAFPETEVEKVRGELVTSLRVAMQDTRHVAGRAFGALAYPQGHPYARVPDGDEATIATLVRQDLERFHRAHYRPEATLLAVVGDLAPAEVLTAVGRVFSSWPRRGTWSLPPIPFVPVPDQPVRRQVRLSGKIQSDLVLGGPGIARTDPAYYEVMLASLILGQLGLMGRLGDRVRERQGMAYYAFTDLRAGLLAGPWSVRAGVSPQHEEQVVASILDEIERFQSRGPDESELADARDFLIGFLALRLETIAGIAQMLADIELFGLGLDYLERYPAVIRSLEAPALMQAARRFSTHAYCVAVAGPPVGPGPRA